MATSASSAGRRSLGVAAALIAVALAAWVVAVRRMQGMDGGPGTELGALAGYVGLWVTMTAAMMLPSVAPMALLFARISGERARRGRAFVPTWIFLAGYLAVWTAYGLAAYGVWRLVRALHPGFLAWHAQGPLVAGGALLVAALYQLTPLKRACLRHCRSPLHFVLHGWREGPAGALRMGGEHGAYCVGCCAGLMLALFAVGVMSVTWMAVAAAVILAEKALPLPPRAPQALAVALAAAGIWVAAAPASVPGLVQPGAAPMRPMR